MLRSHSMFYIAVFYAFLLAYLYGSLGLQEKYPGPLGGNPIAQTMFGVFCIYFFWKAFRERFWADKVMKKEEAQNSNLKSVGSQVFLRRATAFHVISGVVLSAFFGIILFWTSFQRYIAIGLIVGPWCLCLVQIALLLTLRHGFATTKNETAFAQSIERSGGIEKVARRYKRLMFTNTVFYGLLTIAFGYVSYRLLYNLIVNLVFQYSYNTLW